MLTPLGPKNNFGLSEIPSFFKQGVAGTRGSPQRKYGANIQGFEENKKKKEDHLVFQIRSQGLEGVANASEEEHRLRGSGPQAFYVCQHGSMLYV